MPLAAGASELILLSEATLSLLPSSETVSVAASVPTTQP
jgi:hypothetical protein